MTSSLLVIFCGCLCAAIWGFIAGFQSVQTDKKFYGINLVLDIIISLLFIIDVMIAVVKLM